MGEIKETNVRIFNLMPDFRFVEEHGVEYVREPNAGFYNHKSCDCPMDNLTAYIGHKSNKVSGLVCTLCGYQLFTSPFSGGIHDKRDTDELRKEVNMELAIIKKLGVPATITHIRDAVTKFKKVEGAGENV